MGVIKKLKPGLRIIKTVVALFLCLTFFYLIDYEKPLHAALACILVVKESAELSKEYGINRMLATFSGGRISYLVLVIKGLLKIETGSYGMLILIVVGIYLSLICSKMFSANTTISTLAGAIVLITLMGYGESSYSAAVYIFIRTIETLIGIFFAYMVNKHLNFPIIKRKSNELNV